MVSNSWLSFPIIPCGHHIFPFFFHPVCESHLISLSSPTFGLSQAHLRLPFPPTAGHTSCFSVCLVIVDQVLAIVPAVLVDSGFCLPLKNVVHVSAGSPATWLVFHFIVRKGL